MVVTSSFTVNLTQGYKGETTFVFTNTTTSTLTIPEWTWLWEFADGSTSSAENPTHMYTDDGVDNSFAVKLTADDGSYTGTNLPPTYTKSVSAYTPAKFTGDPHTTAAAAMKQYGDTEGDAGFYEYEVTTGHTRTLSGETVYVHAPTIPDFLIFTNSDPADTDHYNPNLASSYKGLIQGAPEEDTDVGTHSLALTLTSTLSNGESVVKNQTFSLTFANHPHMPLWGSEPAKEASVGVEYSEIIKAIDQDIMGEGNVAETLEIEVIPGEIVPGVSAVPIPDWLTFTVGQTFTEVIDGKTKTVRQGHLFGTPTADDIGASIIALQCVDSYGLTMKMVFGLTVF